MKLTTTEKIVAALVFLALVAMAVYHSYWMSEHCVCREGFAPAEAVTQPYLAKQKWAYAA